MSFPGFITNLANVGNLNNLVSVQSQSPTRNIGGIIPNCTIEEEGVDEITKTQHPVEQGAAISDHYYKEPASLTMRVAWSNAAAEAAGDPNYVIDIYNKLLALQVAGSVFQVITGKRLYKNMLMLRIRVSTDETTEYALAIVAEFEEIIIVQTQTTSVPPANQQKMPEQTAAPTNVGSQQLLPATVASDGLTPVPAELSELP